MQISIGFAGRARHGKGTCASTVAAWASGRGIPVQVISFADPLKDFLTAWLGRSEPFRGNDTDRNTPLVDVTWMDLAQNMRTSAAIYWPHQDPEVNPTGRQLLQLFGTDVIRNNFAPDAWFQIAYNRAKAFDGITLMDDVRFPNEARVKRLTVKGIFHHLIKVVRPGIPNIQHKSEDAVDTIDMSWFDMQIINMTDVPSLVTVVEQWCNTALVQRIEKENDARRSLNHQEGNR